MPPGQYLLYFRGSHVYSTIFYAAIFMQIVSRIIHHGSRSPKCLLLGKLNANFHMLNVWNFSNCFSLKLFWDSVFLSRNHGILRNEEVRFFKSTHKLSGRFYYFIFLPFILFTHKSVRQMLPSSVARLTVDSSLVSSFSWNLCIHRDTENQTFRSIHSVVTARRS